MEKLPAASTFREHGNIKKTQDQDLSGLNEPRDVSPLKGLFYVLGEWKWMIQEKRDKTTYDTYEHKLSVPNHKTVQHSIPGDFSLHC